VRVVAAAVRERAAPGGVRGGCSAASVWLLHGMRRGMWRGGGGRAAVAVGERRQRGKREGGQSGAAEPVRAAAAAAGERAVGERVRGRAARCPCGYCTACGGECGAVAGGGVRWLWVGGGDAANGGAGQVGTAEPVRAAAAAAGERAARERAGLGAAPSLCAGGRHGAPQAVHTSGRCAHIGACAGNGGE
jgi:hypothetical protein